MSWRPRALALPALIATLLAGCGGGAAEPQSPFDASLRGGTLRVGVSRAFEGPRWLDPSAGLNLLTVELFRCCIARTLLSYPGTSTAEGGAVLHPDLADREPVLSPNGRTWTFHLKQGIHYAPPFSDRVVESQDVVRAIERTLRVRPPSYEATFLDVIEGAAAYAAGRSDSVAGLEAPDRNTLVLRLNRPVGDLGNRLALPAAAPIPPGAVSENGTLTAIPATGPYRIVGDPANGDDLTLVRNPSWEPETDSLRPAYADRIEVSIAPDPRELVDRLDADEIDLPLFASNPDAAAPPGAVRRYLDSPDLRRRVFGAEGASVRAVSMNLALPPFDDIHVRRAANLAIDRAGLLEADPLATGRPAAHIVPDSLENDLLLSYDPYPTRGGRPDLRQAREEMARSAYDRNGDGICDASACHEVLAATRTEPVYRRQAAIVARDLAKLGIDLRSRAYDPEAFFGRVIAQRAKVPLVVPIAWIADYANASAYFDPLFYGPSFAGGGGSPSLVGAPPSDLRRLGYPTDQVPSIDTTISQCDRQIGAGAFSCWAQADMLLSEQVVPWVPYDFPRNVELVGDRVIRFSWDQSSGTPLPALDRIALR